MERALVIGGSGFIGSHLVERLCRDGYKVSVLVRKNSDVGFIKSLGIELRYADLLDLRSLNGALSGIDTIFCLVNVKPFGKTLQEYKEELSRVHIDGTKNLINACKYNGARRLIYLSSVAAIGYKKGITTYNEFSEANPVDDYGKAKLAAENILNQASQNKELDITILRPPGVFGERGLGVLDKIIFFMEKGIVPVIGSGKNQQSVTYVGNVVNEAIYVASNSAAIGKTYIASDDKPYSVNELVDVVAKVMKKKAFKVHISIFCINFFVSILNFGSRLFMKKELINPESIVAISSTRIFDGSRIFKELGYKQEYSLSVAVEQTIEWYRKNKNA